MTSHHKPTAACFDRNDKLVRVGDMLDVQRAGACRVFLHRGEICFTPYRRIARVCDYFRNDIEVTDATAP